MMFVIIVGNSIRVSGGKYFLIHKENSSPPKAVLSADFYASPFLPL